VLRNDTVGIYLSDNAGSIELRILDEIDIYFQKEDFQRVYQEISSSLSFLETPEQARDFKK